MTSNQLKKKLIILALAVGATFTTIPSVALADSGQIGSDTTPITWQYYSTDPTGEIANNRTDKSGSSVFVAQFHQNFNDAAYGAFGNKGGATLTLNSMTVEAIQGKDGVGADPGETVKDGGFGQDGGLASGMGVYSTSMSNATIALNGAVDIKVIGGKTFSDAMIGTQYQHQGLAGIDYVVDIANNGGEGAKGGVGGNAIARGIDVSNGSGITITGSSLSVSATGELGGHGGYGGAGGIGKTGDAGTDGKDANSLTPDRLGAQTGQTTAQAAQNGRGGEKGGDGLVGIVGNTGGTGGKGADGGNGGYANATGIKTASMSNLNVVVSNITVDATGGNGNNGGTGGKGGTGGTGGVGGDGGQGFEGEIGGDLETAQLTVTPDGAYVVSGGLTAPTIGAGSVAAGASYTVTAYYTQNQILSGTTYGGEGGDGGLGGDGGAGGVGGTGGDGGNGGNGGVATATGFSGTAVQGKITANEVAVTATGGNGARAGFGGAGGDGGVGGAGGDGGKGGEAGKNQIYSGTQKSNYSVERVYKAIHTYNSVTGTWSYSWQLLTTHPQSNTTVTNEQVSVNNTTRTDANDGTGGKGGTGGTGGDGGVSGENGINGFGASAYATGIELESSNVELTTSKITSTAIAGKGLGSITGSGTDLTAGTAGDPASVPTDINGTAGGAGGAGGTGSTLLGTIAQSFNGDEAMAVGFVSTGNTTNIIGASGLEIVALAQDGASYDSAVGVLAKGSTDTYNVSGDFKITADAIGDIDAGTYIASLTRTITDAAGVDIEGGVMKVVATGALDIIASATKGEHTNEADGISADGAELDFYSEGPMTIQASSENTIVDDGYARAITAVNNKTMLFKTKDQDIKVIGGDRSTDHAMSVDGGLTSFDAGTATIGFEGYTTAKNGTLNFKSNTTVKPNVSDPGDFYIENVVLTLTDKLETVEVEGISTFNASTAYFYDDLNDLDKHDTYTYRKFKTNDLVTDGDNTLYMRTNVNGAMDRPVGNDMIEATNVGTGTGTYETFVFDQGMRIGYDNIMQADGNFIDPAAAPVILVKNAGTATVKGAGETVTFYDNGVWNYEYVVTTEKVGNDIVLKSITKDLLRHSTAQKVARDSYKVAAGAAVTFFGNDETLRDRLGDPANFTYTFERENGTDGESKGSVWAKYLGGKYDVDGVDGDANTKYNGFAGGYDHNIGNGWRLGLGFQHVKGDADFAEGSGEIKSNAGMLYGTWVGGKGHYLDILGKFGKVNSDTEAYGGTVPQRMYGSYGGTAFGLSAEYGYHKRLNDNWFIEPMARLSWVRLSGDDYTVNTFDGNMDVSNDTVNNLILRGGFLVGRQFGRGNSLYLKLAIAHNFGGDADSNIYADGKSMLHEESVGGTSFEYGLGGTHKFNDKSSFYLDVKRSSGGDITKTWGVNAGFRFNF